MTSNQIRKQFCGADHSIEVVVLGEIAAQLARLNEQLQAAKEAESGLSDIGQISDDGISSS